MRITLGATAQASLEDILLWTAHRFGERQALHYRDLIQSRLEAVADDRTFDRPLTNLTGKDHHDAYTYIRAGEHIAIIIKGSDTVTVVDFLHSRSDLPSHIVAPSDPDDA